MKISYQIAASLKQFKAIASNELRLIGKAFGRSARVVETPNLNKVEAQPFAMVKSPKGETNVIKNMSVEFLADDHEILQNNQIARYRVHAKHDTITMNYPEPVNSDHMSCRHMAARELERREKEKTTPGIHTKADRAKKFDVKYVDFFSTQRQHLEGRIHDIMLYTDDAHLFHNDGMGQFLEAEFKKLPVGEVKNFAFTTLEHVMTLTIKHTKEGYSASLWDPNNAADHIKMKFNSPRQAYSVSLDKFIGEELRTHYTQKGARLIVYELSKGWAENQPTFSPEIKLHSYRDGGIIHRETPRTDWVNKFNN